MTFLAPAAGDKLADHTPTDSESERKAAFERVTAHGMDRMYGLAYHLLNNPTDAEDACQDALVTAWQAWSRLREPGSFDAWLDRILIRRCIDIMRGRRVSTRDQVRSDLHAGENDATAAVAERDSVQGALRRLSPEHLAVVVLRYWADLTTEQIADRLGIAPGTVRSRLHYALTTLRRELYPSTREDDR